MRCFPSLVLAVLLSAVSVQVAARVLEQKDLFQMQWANDPQIRKDGTQIAYARTGNDIMTDEQSQSLWLIDTATGAQMPLAGGPGHYASPRWSPDGTKIAYLSTGHGGHTQSAIPW